MPTTPARDPAAVRRIILLLGAVTVLPAGCGADEKSQDGDVTSTTTAPTTAPTAAPTTTTTALATTTTAPTTPGNTRSAGTIVVPNVVGKDLQFAQDSMQAAGLYNLTSHDSTGQARSQVLDRNWQVTDQTPAAGSRVTADQRIDLGARKFTD